MKRQILAVALASLFALPALADEIDNGTAQPVKSSMTREQVRAELVASQQGHRFVDGEIGSGLSAPAQNAGKTREQVRAELIDAQSAGFIVVDGETGNRVPRS
jgi:Domain of unknown function (DUF4148)